MKISQTRSILFLTAFLTVVLVSATQARGTAVKATQLVHVQEPVRFFQDGKWTSSNDMILLHVTIANPSVFLPQDAPSPRFVLGDQLCKLINIPLDGNALVLAPLPPPGTTPVLWISPALPVEQLTRARLQSYFAKPPAKIDSFKVTLPPASTASARFATFHDLRAQLSLEKTK